MNEEKRPVVLWDINKLVPYEKNAKKHSAESVTRLARSIDKLGITPLEIEPDGTIIKGHGRRLALVELGRAKVPVIVRDDLTKTQADALRIADNQAVSNEIDFDILTAEAIRLDEEGFNLSDMAFTDAEIKSLSVDIGEIADSAFTTDITAAVETQKSENKEAESLIDAKEGPVGEALGFKKVTTEQSRIIRGFMAKVEADSGLTGAQALIAHIEAVTA